MNYANTKIYKIVCNVTGKVYIGSTTRKYLSERLAHHRQDYELYKKGINGYITSFQVLENNDYNIILLANHPCNEKNERNAIERNYIETIDCVNKYHPGRTKKEYVTLHKEKTAEYQKEYQKEYRQSNQDTIKEKQQTYYAKNKERILAKTNCPICNIMVNKISRHLKTKTHINNCVVIAEQKVNV